MKTSCVTGKEWKKKRVTNTDRDCTCRKIHFQLKTLVTVTMMILKKYLEEDEGEYCWVYDNI
jgi:hypothetical protein